MTIRRRLTAVAATAAALGALSLGLGAHASAETVPTVSPHVSAASTWACVVVRTVNVGACVDNPLAGLPRL